MFFESTEKDETLRRLQAPLVNPVIQQPLIATEVMRIKGPIGSFIPRRGNNALMSEVALTDRIPVGYFSDCAIFDDDAQASAEQKRLRRQIPLAMRVTRMLGEHIEPTHDDAQDGYISWRLTDLIVHQAYQQATVVEAARQYFEKEQSGELTDAEATYLKEQLNRAQDKLYPRLDPAISHMALDSIEGRDMGIERAMSNELLSEWHRFLHDKYDPVFDEVYANYPYAESAIIGERLRSMTEEFMRASGLPMAEHSADKGRWKCVYDEAASGFRVEVGSKTVICGNRDKPLSSLGFEKLMLHEIVVHAWRAENGSKTGFAAFQMGLPGSIGPEEGLGLLVESLWSGEDPYALSREHFRYVALSYTSGVYDGTLHSEQETYDYIKALMDHAGFGDDKAELYRHVMRPFRGMPEGCRMRSNALYLGGKIDMMRYLQDAQNRGEQIDGVFEQLLASRTNPIDPEHRDLLTRALKERTEDEGFSR